MNALHAVKSETAAPYIVPVAPHMQELQDKLTLLHAQLLAVTGSQGVEVLHEMGDAAANAYLAGCMGLAHDCLVLTKGGE